MIKRYERIVVNCSTNDSHLPKRDDVLNHYINWRLVSVEVLWTDEEGEREYNLYFEREI